MLAGADIWINGGTRNPGFDRIPRNFIFLGVGTVFGFFFSPSSGRNFDGRCWEESVSGLGRRRLRARTKLRF